MRKTKMNQASRIAKLEEVVSKLYITQMELIRRYEALTKSENDEEE